MSCSALAHCTKSRASFWLLELDSVALAYSAADLNLTLSFVLEDINGLREIRIYRFGRFPHLSRLHDVWRTRSRRA